MYEKLYGFSLYKNQNGTQIFVYFLLAFGPRIYIFLNKHFLNGIYQE